MSAIQIQKLFLKNFATFEDQEIPFGPNLNAMVGETGSGKSLILDALSITLGSRPDKKFIRKGSGFSTLELSIKIKSQVVFNFLDNIGHPLDSDNITIKRIIYQNGTTKNYFNQSICTVQAIQSFSRKYIDLVGQFENQKLLSEDYQLYLIDSYGDLGDKYLSFKSSYLKLIELQNEIINLKENIKKAQAHRELAEYQIEELEKLSPSLQDEEQLFKIKNAFINKEKKAKIYSSILQKLNDSESNNILDDLKSILKTVEREKTIFGTHHNEKISSALTSLNDFFDMLESELEINDQVDINKIIDRIDFYQKVKTKHKTDTCGLITLLNTLRGMRNLSSKDDEYLAQLEIAKEKLQENVEKNANTLHQERTTLAKKLSLELSDEIHKLNMEGATILISANESPINEFGKTKISFFAETNKGEGIHLLKDVASGGELSRILLAIRKISSNKDSISIFLFDEIDTGVGGETAIKVGKTLKSVSENSQVITITHLPQIAHFADTIISVTKDHMAEEKRTKSFIKVIANNQTEKNKILLEMTGNLEIRSKDNQEIETREGVPSSI